MAEKANYQISNYEAAAQLGALAGKIQALLIIEPIPSPEDFLRIILALETLSELCQVALGLRAW